VHLGDIAISTWSLHPHTMAQVNGNGKRVHESFGPSLFVRKKMKLLDLPISSTQRSNMEAMLFTLKKKGDFDDIRKKVYKQFDEGVCPITFIITMKRILNNITILGPKGYPQISST
jgi:hypothetical protein